MLESRGKLILSNHNLQNLNQDDLFTTLITDNEYCVMDFEILDRFLDEVKSSWESEEKDANNQKGRSLEDIGVYLLNCVEPFDVEYDYKTPINQLDSLVEVLNFRGNNPFLSEIGQFFCAECKNENSTVGITHVQKVGAIMQEHHTNLTLLFSRKKLTGHGKFEAAQGYVYTLFVGKNKRILSITYADIRELCDSKQNFLTMLRQKNKDLRFLQLSSNTLETELRKLKKLLDEGTIDSEDFKRLKQDKINSYLN